MSALRRRFTADLAAGRERRREGLQAVAFVVALLWVLQLINAIDGYGLNTEGGLHPRSVGHVWEILTSPFLHWSFGHLIANTIPLAFCGWLIALRGASRFALVSVFVMIVGGLGTWLIAPSGSDTVGASGVVFGLAAYLIARGAFTRRFGELLMGAIVAVVLGGALTTSLVPHSGVSWQGHLCGGIAGVLAAWVLSGGPQRGRSTAAPLEGAAPARRLPN